MATIGFIGIGNMGRPMAVNLLRAGHAVTVFDLSQSACNALAEAGAAVGADSASTVAGKDIVISMLPAGDDVRGLYLDTLKARIAATTLVIDCSTIDVASARAVHEFMAQAGVAFLDAPVSGGIMGAAAGTLAFMVGGEAQAFQRALPILEVMGANIVHTGGPGNGQAAKICNNMMLGVTMLAVCEGFMLADKLGLDRQTLYDVVTKASGQSWAISKYCPVPGPVASSPASNDYKAGFTTAMMLKDMRLSQSEAGAGGVDTQMAALATEFYQRYVDGGGAAMDFSGVFRMLNET